MNGAGEEQGPVLRAGGRWVIETVSRRGAGVPQDRVREVTQFWTNGGRLIAEHDPDRTPEQWEIVMGRADWTDALRAAASSVVAQAREVFGDTLQPFTPNEPLRLKREDAACGVMLLAFLRDLQRVLNGGAGDQEGVAR